MALFRNRSFVFSLTCAGFCVLTTASKACYYPNGIQATDNIPCSDNDDSVSVCCGPSFNCLSNGLCQQGQNLFRGTCTDAQWKSGACPGFCKSGEELDNWMSSCPSLGPGYFCCGSDDSCCGDSKLVLDLGPGTVASSTSTSSSASTTSISTTETTTAGSKTSGQSTSTTAADQATTTTLLSSASTTTTITASATLVNDKDKSGPNIGVAAGVGVGVGVAVCAGIGAFLFFFFRRRRHRQAASDEIISSEAKPRLVYQKVSELPPSPLYELPTLTTG